MIIPTVSYKVLNGQLDNKNPTCAFYTKIKVIVVIKSSIKKINAVVVKIYLGP